jgi:N-acetyl sugar amidotransferase
MDSSDPQITFDSQGVCNHCHQYTQVIAHWNLPQVIANKTLQASMDKIRESGKGKDFDCIVGLSGGVDSSYIALLAKEHNLRPLCVHLDNGWNSELATANIHSIVSKLGFELYTHVIDWDEFKDLQRSFFKAGVVDIEVLSDHAIFGVILQLAKKHGIKYILSGANIATEAVMPKAWVHRKQDLTNILDIQKKFGTRPIKTFPQVSTLGHVIAMYGMGYKVVKPLNMIEYNKTEVKQKLQEQLGWRDYGGKHYESIFTKYYQAHILPKKFNIDKRKAHLSTLICSQQMTREEALAELAKPLYEAADLQNDTEYVRKKLGFGEAEFTAYLQAPPVSHFAYKTDQYVFDILKTIKQKLGRADLLSN